MATSGAIILVTSTGKGTGRLDDEHRDSRVLRDSLDTISPRHPHTDVPPTQKTIRFTTHSTTGLSLLLLSFFFSFSFSSSSFLLLFPPFSLQFFSRSDTFHARLTDPNFLSFLSSSRRFDPSFRSFYRTIERISRRESLIERRAAFRTDESRFRGNVHDSATKRSESKDPPTTTARGALTAPRSSSPPLPPPPRRRRRRCTPYPPRHGQPTPTSLSPVPSPRP